MIILDKPYVSNFLAQTIAAGNIPTLDTKLARTTLAAEGLSTNSLLTTTDFVATAKDQSPLRLYSNSENAINWIASNLGDTELPRMIDLFKNKVRFRELIQPLYPEYFFKEVSFEELGSVDPATLSIPCVVKPAVGFFSLGVHVVTSHDSWNAAVAAIKAEVEHIATMYPTQVLNLDTFIIEECIDGEEFAVDAYFDSNGNPVVLNILGHLFASEEDVSDRVYYTSAELITRWLAPFTQALKGIGERAKLRDFPVHVELRVNPQGHLNFIEVNPMRFAGWCVTDLAHHAYAINPYEYYLQNRKPNWDAILPERKDTIYGVVIADVAPDIDTNNISAIDYDAFASRFAKPLELRRIDYTEYPVFAFMFTETTAQNIHELKAMLSSDLKEFIQC